MSVPVLTYRAAVRPDLHNPNRSHLS